MAKPVLKWAGGKRLLLPCILSLMPKDFKERRLHEPFFGSGVLTFRLEPKAGTANDINKKLMNFYIVLRDYPDELIEDLKTHKISREYYYRARTEFNELVKKELPYVVKRNFNPPHIRLASLFLYLNKTAYNGLYRENIRGEFNVPYGRPTSKKIIDEKAIKGASRVLKNIELHYTDFSYILNKAESGDIVYLDPPYYSGGDNTKFSHYHNGRSFPFNDQRRLRDLCIKLHQKGVYFILSNSADPMIKKLYLGIKAFYISEVNVRRSISGKCENRNFIREILVTNIPPDEQLGFKEAAKILNRKEKDIKGCSFVKKNLTALQV